jgi:hypothetical protein
LVFSVTKRHFLLHFFYKRCQAGTQGSGSKNAGQCHKTKLRSEKIIVAYKKSAKIPHNFFTSRHIETGIRSFLLKIVWLNPAAAEKKGKSQCCGSGALIPDPGSKFSIPDPYRRIKEFKYF